MNFLVTSSNLKGTITIPSSKSHTIRAFILSAIAEGTSCIINPLLSDDVLSTIQAVKQIGAEVTEKKQDDSIIFEIQGAGKNLHLPQKIIDVQNSGSLLYFLIPILSTLPGSFTFTGDESIKKRPVNHLASAIKQLGAEVSTVQDYCPITVRGPVNLDKTLVTEGSLSQYISGFMMAAALTKKKFYINLTNPKETPYLKMTSLWLKECNVKTRLSSDYKKIKISGKGKLSSFVKEIPGDWESAAFPLVAALITQSQITIRNVDFSKTQGDRIILKILKSIGAKIKTDKKNNLLIIKKSELKTKNKPLTIDISDIPDAICILLVTACFTKGNTIIKEISICRKKETDRVQAMCSQLIKLGADIKIKDETIYINGNNCKLHGGTVSSFKDHRIAMAFTCFALGLKPNDSVIIEDAECYKISFPDFYDKMKNINANIQQQ